MVAYETLRDKHKELIFKGLQGSVFIAAQSAAAITADTLFSATDGTLLALPTGYADLGWTTEDGAAFAGSPDVTQIRSWGTPYPTRQDVQTDETTMAVTAQETKLLTMAIYTGVDQADIPSSTGAVDIKKPLRPSRRHYRVLSLAVDELEGGEVYIGRFLPNATPTDRVEQAHANQDSPIMWGVTFSAEPDDELGIAEEFFIDGPGWRSVADAAGTLTGGGG